MNACQSFAPARPAAWRDAICLPAKITKICQLATVGTAPFRDHDRGLAAEARGGGRQAVKVSALRLSALNAFRGNGTVNPIRSYYTDFEVLGESQASLTNRGLKFIGHHNFRCKHPALPPEMCRPDEVTGVGQAGEHCLLIYRYMEEASACLKRFRIALLRAETIKKSPDQHSEVGGRVVNSPWHDDLQGPETVHARIKSFDDAFQPVVGRQKPAVQLEERSECLRFFLIRISFGSSSVNGSTTGGS